MKGSCLCRTVQYEITPPVKAFKYCHCTRCRKASGTAHAANMFIPTDQFKWLSGDDNIGSFKPEDAQFFTNFFCKTCGSAMPRVRDGNPMVVIPAGSLDSDPEIRPSDSIHWASRAPWAPLNNRGKFLAFSCYRDQGVSLPPCRDLAKRNNTDIVNA